MSSNVFVTGIGMVTPAGCGAEATWASLLAGERAIRPVQGIDLSGCSTQFAGQVGAFSPPDGTEGWDRLSQFVVGACKEALYGIKGTKVSIDSSSLKHIYTSIGSSKGGIISFASTSLTFYKTRYRFNSHINTLGDIPPDAPVRRVAAYFGLSGGMHATVAACTTGMLAMIRGVQLILDGDADAVVCGGADASLHRMWFAAFEQMGVLAPEHPDRGPGWACRPFDRTRTGFALGEGAAVVLLESERSIRESGRRPIARIAGYACGTDPSGITQLNPAGDELAHVIRLACDRAGYAPHQLTCVHCHGTGTPANDLVETRAIRAALGDAIDRTPLVSIKGAIGHLLGGAGAVEMAVSVLSCRDGRSPGTCTLIEPDPALGPVVIPREAFEIGRGPILKTAMGFGGHLAAAVIAPV